MKENPFHYSRRYAVVWNGKQSHRHLMHDVLTLAWRMRTRGHSVTVVILGREKGQQ